MLHPVRPLLPNADDGHESTFTLRSRLPSRDKPLFTPHLKQKSLRVGENGGDDILTKNAMDRDPPADGAQLPESPASILSGYHCRLCLF